MTEKISAADVRRISAAVTQLAAVEQLHHRSEEDAIAHDCAMGQCDHEEAARGDECPTHPVSVCACCFGHLNLDDETTIPRWALWPCATAKAFGAVA